MRFFRRYILFFAFMAITVFSPAQFDPSSISRVKNGKIEFLLDVRWTDAQKKEVGKLFNLDSSLWLKINLNTSEVQLDSVPWKVKHISQFVVELSKNIEDKPVFHFNENDVFLIDENWPVAPGYVDQEKVIYGANRFKNPFNFQYSNGKAQFYLQGFLKTKQAYIAGSFNNWDPLKTSMQKVDSGWVVNIPLPAGKYFYKFILDGNWMEDPNNQVSENDSQGNINSTIYCSNFLFNLKGFAKARKVMVAGTFNNWDKKELKMNPVPGGWSLPVYLKDGTYSYKFLVDNEWITDPSNMVTRTDGKGNQNSVIGTGEEYIFRLNGFLDAGRVFLAGNFNNWDPNELMMEKTGNGWQLPYKLAPGNYEYKFIMDGRWIPDPANPYCTGSGEFVNSCLAFKADFTFVLDEFPDAHEVKVTGSFNNWNPEGYRMVKKDGKWTFPVYLSPGKYVYKLIVDGKWIIDPTNKLWEDNEYGTGNSVIWIQPAP
jgi:hypothetical protein